MTLVFQISFLFFSLKLFLLLKWDMRPPYPIFYVWTTWHVGCLSWALPRFSSQPSTEAFIPPAAGRVGIHGSAESFPGDCFIARELSAPRSLSFSWGDHIKWWVRKTLTAPPSPSTPSIEEHASQPSPTLYFPRVLSLRTLFINFLCAD